jgi:hypothetical protein
MDNKEYLYKLIIEYKNGNISTEFFCDNFDRVYNIELDYDTINEIEHELFKSLSYVAARFSPYEADKKIPKAFTTEKEVKEKVEEVYSRLVK